MRKRGSAVHDPPGSYSRFRGLDKTGCEWEQLSNMEVRYQSLIGISSE